jgi:hypothetical protein
VSDNSHVLGSMSGSQPSLVFIENDIQDPVETVLDTPYKMPLII